MDTKGNLVKDYQDTTIFGEGSIQKDRSARFTGKPYDEDLQAYVFPYRNYDATTARWTSSDPAGYPDGINNQFYAAVPTYALDPLGLRYVVDSSMSASNIALANKVITNVMNSSYGRDPNSTVNKIYNDPNNNVNVKIQEGSYTNYSNRYDPSTNTIYISPDDAANNKGYVLDNRNGGATEGKQALNPCLYMSHNMH